MKRIIALSVCIFMMHFLSAQSEYYWYRGEKKTLNLLYSRQYVVVKSPNYDGVKMGIVEVEALPHDDVSRKKIDEQLQDRLYWAIVDMSKNVPLKNSKQNEVLYQSPLVLDGGGKLLVTSHLFYVKLRQLHDFEILRQFANANGVSILSQNTFMPLWYTLSCIGAVGNAIEMANLFYESGLFEAAEPDLSVDDMLHCSSAPLFNQQWALYNHGQNGGVVGVDINCCAAHELTKGSGDVVVAVIDEDVQLNHVDIVESFCGISYDADSRTFSSRVYGEHGTCCAGIIGASKDNNIGIVGIAPQCKLMPVSV